MRHADVAVVAVARHEDDDRDEAVELVAPRKDAHARPLLERQDGGGEVVERVLVDLEELVARIGLEHVEERLAGMARRVVAGAGKHVRRLAAEIGNGAHRARIGGRGEQADHAQLAGERAFPRRRVLMPI